MKVKSEVMNTADEGRSHHRHSCVVMDLFFDLRFQRASMH